MPATSSASTIAIRPPPSRWPRVAPRSPPRPSCRVRVRDRLHQPADTGHRQGRCHGRGRRACRLQGENAVDLSTTGPTVAGHRAGVAAAQHHLDRLPGQRRRPGAAPARSASWFGPEGAFAELEPILSLRQGVLRWREAGPRADAKLATICCPWAAGPDVGSMAMGTRPGSIPKMMLDIINVPSGRNSATMDKFPRRCCRAPSTSALPRACPTRTCGSASTRPRRWACRWWSAARCARCWP